MSILDERRTTNRMGYRPDLPDHRDYKFSMHLTGTPIPPVSSRVMVPKFDQPVIDQGYLGSCVGCSVATMMSHVRKVAPRSELQIYYEARRLINETDVDNGAYIRDGIRVISNLGAGRKHWWPYKEENVFVDPPLNVDRDALLRKIFTYYRLENGNDYRQCLAEGFPFVLGFSVYTDFMTPFVSAYGLVRMPSWDAYVIGGHAICVIGYDVDFPNSDMARRLMSAGVDKNQLPQEVYIVRNSWGKDWGDEGNFAIDARFFDNSDLAGDAWTIRKK